MLTQFPLNIAFELLVDPLITALGEDVDWSRYSVGSALFTAHFSPFNRYDYRLAALHFSCYRAGNDAINNTKGGTIQLQKYCFSGIRLKIMTD
jgi:hypothetical protein